jgi:hypothetical protein
MEPAARAIGDLHAALASTAPEAMKYLPNQLLQVQKAQDALDLSFARHDYAAVLAAAPAVMHDVQRLAAATAARKREVAQGLQKEWSALAASLPDGINILRARIDSHPKRLGSAPGIDPLAARKQLDSDELLWSKAQAAFATGNLDEAVRTGRTLEAALSDLAAELP